MFNSKEKPLVLKVYQKGIKEESLQNPEGEESLDIILRVCSTIC